MRTPLLVASAVTACCLIGGGVGIGYGIWGGSTTSARNGGPGHYNWVCYNPDGTPDVTMSGTDPWNCPGNVVFLSANANSDQ